MVKRTLLILRGDFKEMRSEAAFRILVAVVALVSIAAVVGISIVLRLQSWYGIHQAFPVLDLIGTGSLFPAVVVLIAFIWAFASLPVINEKVNGNVESLLATPIVQKLSG
jgi:hypothetical protein